MHDSTESVNFFLLLSINLSLSVTLEHKVGFSENLEQ